MDEQGILDLLLSSQPENIALAEQLLIGAGILLKTLLDEFGYSQIGIKSFQNFKQTNLVIKGLSTETIPKLPASIVYVRLADIAVKKINLVNEPNLKIFECYNNQLSSLKVQGCAMLEGLFCAANQLSELNLVGCENLQRLGCDNNQLIELNVKDCAILERLYCDEKVKILNAPNNCEMHFYSK